MNKLTALVTGASQGLGKSFAFELASKKIDLILVSLPSSGLPELASFIRRNFDIEVVYIEADLTKMENISDIFRTLKDSRLVPDILINNAGSGNTSWFLEKDINFYKDQIDLNITGTVLLTRLFLDQVNYTTPVYILNVSSLGGVYIVPGKQVYGATKAFINYFTKCLRLERSNTNLNISLLIAGGIDTSPEQLVLHDKLKGISKASILEPDRVARNAINGLLKGKQVIIPGTVNKILVMAHSLIPSFVKDFVINKKVKHI